MTRIASIAAYPISVPRPQPVWTAHEENLTLKEAALKSGHNDEKRFDEIVDPAKMVGNGDAGS
jgi:hypothetical protein